MDNNKDITSTSTNTNKENIKSISFTIDANSEIMELEKKIHEINKTSYSLRNRVLLLNIDIETKAEIIRKLEKCSGDNKVIQWIENLTKIPFGNYKNYNTKTNPSQFLAKVKQNLDKASYGNENAKEQILGFVGRNLNNSNSKGNVLALEGEKGTGKTRLIKEGLSKTLDRPFYSINFGGMKDTTILLGHSSTYMGSKYGLIADIIIKSKCMNPIIYLDEIDKIGDSSSANELYGVLTHLLDETQNHEFFDNYFDNVKLDLSKVLFVISYNNPQAIDSVAKDRMKIVKIKNPTTNQKIEICKKHIIPDILNDINLSKKVQFGDEEIRYIIENKTNEHGTRELKNILETIVEKINLAIQLKSKSIIKHQKDLKSITRKSTIKITKDIIDKLIDNNTNENCYFNSMYT